MKNKIIALVEEVLNVPEGTVDENTRAEDLEEWDSLAHVMIIGGLEDTFGIVISLDEAVEITGMKDILKLAGCVEE